MGVVSDPKTIRATHRIGNMLKKKMAETTRLELATSGVTGRRSNQLNYDPSIFVVGETGIEPVTLGL